MSDRPDGRGCGKPMGLSGHVHCYCGQIGVPLCRECVPIKFEADAVELLRDKGRR